MNVETDEFYKDVTLALNNNKNHFKMFNWRFQCESGLKKNGEECIGISDLVSELTEATEEDTRKRCIPIMVPILSEQQRNQRFYFPC